MGALLGSVELPAFAAFRRRLDGWAGDSGALPLQSCLLHTCASERRDFVFLC